jgi:homospermidine synthase
VDSSSRHLLVIGCGSVSQCALPLLIDYFLLKQHIKTITILDAIDRRARIQTYLADYEQISYRQEMITSANYAAILNNYLSAGDILLDLAFNLETKCLLRWCHDHQICFVNTSVELWNPFDENHRHDPRLLTLYHRQMQLLDMQNEIDWNKQGPTAILDHGCNPGLVSHFVKRGLVDMAQHVLKQTDRILSDHERDSLANACHAKNYPGLAYLLGIKTIHISERDTQVCVKPKCVNEFVNTWSIDGLAEEGIAPAEMGWGTHEIKVPTGAHFHETEHDSCNQICLSSKGMNTWVTHLFSYVQ